MTSRSRIEFIYVGKGSHALHTGISLLVQKSTTGTKPSPNRFVLTSPHGQVFRWVHFSNTLHFYRVVSKQCSTDMNKATFLMDYYDPKGSLVHTTGLSSKQFTEITGEKVRDKRYYERLDKR